MRDDWDAATQDAGYWDSVERDAAPGRTPIRRAIPLAPIQVLPGEIDTLADAGERALQESHTPIFQRGGYLVRPAVHEVSTAAGAVTRAAGLANVTMPAMVDTLNRAVAWEKYDGRRKKLVPVDPPPAVAAVILSRVGQWQLPSIAGVITTPTLRRDGSVLDAPGYDAQTRLFHVAERGLTLSPDVHAPTRKCAERAIEELRGLLINFPFSGAVDEAVALSAIVTAVVRGALSVAPLHAFRAFAAGSGKSYLSDVASAISTARPCPVMAAAPKEDETEKRLTGLLLGGYPVISIDNVNGQIGSDLLCQAVERPVVRVRPLGISDLVEIESRATIFVNGNGLRIRGDLTRRTMFCTLDAKMERPELRTFPFDPVENILTDRARYVSACLTIVRAYLAAGAPLELAPLGSYADWSAMVRSPLVWLGCEDPVKSMETARDGDPELADLRELVAAWETGIGVDVPVTAREAAEAINERQDTIMGEPTEYRHPELRDVLTRLVGERGGLNTRRLGNWLADREGRMVGTLRFVRAGTHAGIVKWKLTDR